MRVIRRPERRRGFTLIELLVVIGIIVLLVSILLPVVSQVRLRAYVANTTAEMQRIQSACQLYYNTFHAYPGPVAEANLAIAMPPSTTPTGNSGITGAPIVTSSENLVLGLFGFLTPAPAGSGAGPTLNLMPQTHDPVSLNPLHPGIAGHFMDYIPEELSLGAPLQVTPPMGSSWGQYVMDANGGPSTPTQAHDGLAPEFLDKIPDPMPILYVRARAGAPGIESTSAPFQQYNHFQLAMYGFTAVNPMDFSTPNPVPAGVVVDPPNWTWYFQNPALSGLPRGKDTFILISAGPDRRYGTQDDIIVTP